MVFVCVGVGLCVGVARVFFSRSRDDDWGDGGGVVRVFVLK